MVLTRSLLFVLFLSPAAWLFAGAWRNTLGPDPQEALLHGTGIWALRFLLLTLAVTPLRRWSGWNAPLRYRRMLGLFAFFYASLHGFLFWATELQLDPVALWRELGERLYLFIGFAAWLWMVVLAATSPHGVRRRLRDAWRRIHRAVYLVAGLAVAHFWLSVKADWLEPLVYAILLIFLLAWRVYARLLKLPATAHKNRKQTGENEHGHYTDRQRRAART